MEGISETPEVFLEVPSPATEEGRKFLEFGPEGLQRRQAVGEQEEICRPG